MLLGYGSQVGAKGQWKLVVIFHVKEVRLQGYVAVPDPNEAHFSMYASNIVGNGGNGLLGRDLSFPVGEAMGIREYPHTKVFLVRSRSFPLNSGAGRVSKLGPVSLESITWGSIHTSYKYLVYIVHQSSNIEQHQLPGRAFCSLFPAEG